MKISFAGFVLCDGQAVIPFGITLNGVRVLELVDMARAASKGIFARFNSQNTLQFSVSQVFGSYADAEDFAFTLEAIVPINGVLTITQTGAAAGRPQLVCPNAALATVAPVVQGVRVVTTYTIQGGRFMGGNPPGLIADNTEANTVRGNAAAATGAESIAVVFPAQIQNPVVTSLVALLVAGVSNPGILGVTGLTGQGMTVQLDGPAPAGFAASWQVNSGTD